MIKHIKNILGLTILESMVATAIVGIGFVAILQMTNFSVLSIDSSGERTKASYLVSMVAEDIISEKHSDSPTTNKKLMDYLVDNRHSSGSSWRMGTCSSGSSSSGNHSNALQNKVQKWDNRFSRKRIKCKGAQDIKFLKVFDICRSGCRYTNSTIYDKWYLGKMEVNLNDGKKKNCLYFPIH